MTKRILDFTFALIGLVFCLPAFIGIYFYIKGKAMSPVFETCKRVGKNQKPFNLLRFNLPKFRDENVSLNGHKSAPSSLMKLARGMRLDTLPVLINILKGDMSFVGPSPERFEFIELYSKEDMAIFCARPGLFNPYNLSLHDSPIYETQDGKKQSKNAREVLKNKKKAELDYVKSKLWGKDIRVISNFFITNGRNFVVQELDKETESKNFFMPFDLLLVICSYFLAYNLRFDWRIPLDSLIVFFASLPIVIIARMAMFYRMGLYQNLWKYVGIRDLISISMACTFSSILIVTAIFMFGIREHSRSILFIDLFLCHTLIGGSRLIFRVYAERLNCEDKVRRNILIFGAGDVGELLLRMLDKEGKDKYNVVGFVDDNPEKRGRKIHGISVIGEPKDIPHLTSVYRVDEVLITVAHMTSDQMKRLLRFCKEANVRSRIVPAVSDVLSGTIHLSKLRKVEIWDLFGRKPVELDLSAINSFIRGKRIMITGAGGSIGSELTRQIVEHRPKSLILVDKNENYLFEILCEIEAQDNGIEIFDELCNITNKTKQNRIFQTHKPEVVFHAAAHKHVPLSEKHPEEAIWNNVLGTKVIADLSLENGIEDFVMVSTDKAVNPSGVMGVTKRIAELYIQALAKSKKTKFVTVRFGNVMNSNGSVIPIFRKQIEKGGPITITHPEVERYFMSIQEAVQLILQAVTMGKNAEIFVLEMGKSIKIKDLAVELIQLAGLRPYDDIVIKFTGLRPGEKLYEELVGTCEEPILTTHPSIKTLKLKNTRDLKSMEAILNDLTRAIYDSDVEKIIKELQKIVPEYTPKINTSHDAPLPDFELNGTDVRIPFKISN